MHESIFIFAGVILSFSIVSLCTSLFFIELRDRMGVGLDNETWKVTSWTKPEIKIHYEIIQIAIIPFALSAPIMTGIFLTDIFMNDGKVKDNIFVVSFACIFVAILLMFFSFITLNRNKIYFFFLYKVRLKVITFNDKMKDLNKKQ